MRIQLPKSEKKRKQTKSPTRGTAQAYSRSRSKSPYGEAKPMMQKALKTIDSGRSAYPAPKIPRLELMYEKRYSGRQIFPRGTRHRGHSARLGDAIEARILSGQHRTDSGLNSWMSLTGAGTKTLEMRSQKGQTGKKHPRRKYRVPSLLNKVRSI